MQGVSVVIIKVTVVDNSIMKEFLLLAARRDYKHIEYKYISMCLSIFI